MNRRTKWLLGVTVALITAASLRITIGHHHWSHHHRGQKHENCRSDFHKHEGKEKSQTPSQKNQ